jgi:hypothetical protein
MNKQTSQLRLSEGTEQEEALIDELDQLRVSNRCSLSEYMAKVKKLQAENAYHREHGYDLQTQLAASMKREELYRKQLELLGNEQDMEATKDKEFSNQKVLNNENLGNLLAIRNSMLQELHTDVQLRVRTIDTSLKQFPRGDASTNFYGTSKSEMHVDNKRWGTIGSVKEKEFVEVERKGIVQKPSFERERRELIAEWKSKLENRDTALQNMEFTAMAQGSSIAELQTMLDTREKKYKDKESKLKKEIEHLRRKLNDKCVIIAEKTGQLRGYQDYIQEVTQLLEETYSKKR